jgi:hypothetical protein
MPVAGRLLDLLSYFEGLLWHGCDSGLLLCCQSCCTGGLAVRLLDWQAAAVAILDAAGSERLKSNTLGDSLDVDTLKRHSG